jgi:hypothetical protein
MDFKTQWPSTIWMPIWIFVKQTCHTKCGNDIQQKNPHTTEVIENGKATLNFI